MCRPRNRCAIQVLLVEMTKTKRPYADVASNRFARTQKRQGEIKSINIKTKIAVILLPLLSSASIAALPNTVSLDGLFGLMQTQEWSASEALNDGANREIVVTRSPIKLNGAFDISATIHCDATGDIKALKIFGGNDENGDGVLSTAEWRELADGAIVESNGKTVGKICKFEIGSWDAYALTYVHQDGRPFSRVYGGSPLWVEYPIVFHNN